MFQFGKSTVHARLILCYPCAHSTYQHNRILAVTMETWRSYETCKKKIIRFQSSRGEGSCFEKQKYFRNNPPGSTGLSTVNGFHSFFCTTHKIRFVWVVFSRVGNVQTNESSSDIHISLRNDLMKFLCLLVCSWDQLLEIILAGRRGSSLWTLKRWCSSEVLKV